MKSEKMTLKKPSQLFQDGKSSNNNSSENVTEIFNKFSDLLNESHVGLDRNVEEQISDYNELENIAEIFNKFSTSFDKFEENIELIDDLNLKLNELTEQIDSKVFVITEKVNNKVDKDELEDVMFSHLLVLDEKVDEKIKNINKTDLFEFRKTASKLTEIVENLQKNELPKYRKRVIDGEVKISEKFDKFKEEVNNIQKSSSDDLQEKLENFADTVDDNFLTFSKVIHETKEYVNETTETYKKLYKIIENKGQKENEKLEEYSLVLENFNAKFLDFQEYIEDEIKKYESVNSILDEKLFEFQKDLNTWKESTEKNIDDLGKQVIDDVSSFKTDIKSDISSLKTEITIYEKHNKKLANIQEDTQSKLKIIDDYIKSHHNDIEKLKEEIYHEVGNVNFGNLQENVYKLNRKLEYIEKVYTNINPEDIVNEVINENLAEPSSSKNKDPLTPLDKKYVTLDQLQEHYRLFINRIQQQISTLGGGGEVSLKYLDDVVGIATNSSAYDGKFLQYNHSIGKFQFVAVDVNGEENIIYVAKDGDDSNNGTLGRPKLTIKSAVETIVSAGVTDRVIKVAPGTYIENNPIILPDEVTVIGHSLRETTIIPQNDNEDLFYVGNGNYISNFSFRGSLPGKSIISFDPLKPRYIKQSPYIQNCTNFIPDSIGLKIDGNYAIGPLKSMVLDSYTQYNQGGIGVSITNQGYAQLVSLFTICNEISVFCGSGAACDLNNSNSSFGNYGLIADGLSPKKYSGITTVASGELSDTFVIHFSNPVLNVQNAIYDNTTGLTTITVSSNHNFNVGMGVTISGLGFTNPSVSGIVTFPSGNFGYVFEIVDIVSPTSFSVYTGVSTLPYTYSSGGTCSVNIVRPYDGQGIYFNQLFYTVKKLNIINGGSGYTTLPTITIDPPSTSWGIKAEAIPIIENGVLVGVDMISNGRGYTSVPNVTISSGINTATALAELSPEYYTIRKSTEIVNNTCIITINENVPFSVGVGTEVKFFKQSRILATSHSFEFIGSGVDISNAIPFIGGKPPNEENETDSRNGGLVVYTSTNQSGNFKIGDGVIINQNTSSITGNAYQKSLIASITPYVLSLGGF